MWVTPEQIEYARQTDLLTYLQNYEPDNLQRIGTGTYCTKEHDSLKISNGLWHWFSRHIGGKNALDYLIKVRGFSFTQAVMVLNNIVPEAQIFRKSFETPKTLELPKFHSDIQRVKSYLMKRFVSSTIWLPVTTVHVMSFCESLDSRRKSSTVFLIAPMLQRPHEVHLPEQAIAPDSTGFVRWYVVLIIAPSSDMSTALNVVEPMSIPR